MNFLYPTHALAFFSSLFGNAQTQPLANQEVIVYQGRTMKVIVPERPLASGSLTITSIRNGENDYAKEVETYTLIQQIVKLWEKQGITNYLTFCKVSPDSKSLRWEIVPYSSKGWRFWKQLKVLWKISFGSSSVPYVERQKMAKKMEKDHPFSESRISAITQAVQGNDPFCDSKVIEKQLVFEGKEINILYNYAPIALGEGKLHFLMVPKQHRPKFSDLTQSEYVECMQLSEKLLSFYKQKGFQTAYLFDKTGAEAGQTVPHWHEHIVLTATKTEELLGQLKVFKNMLFGSSPLPPKELHDRVKNIKRELYFTVNNVEAPD